MLKSSHLYWIVFFLWTIRLSAQTEQTVLLPTDSTHVAIPDSGIERNHWLRHFFTHDYPNPRKAVLFGIIPGGGQIYNKKWWKLPLVYGALGGMVYLEISNIKQHRALVYNYRLLKDGNPDTNPTQVPYNRIDEVSMKSYRDQFERYVELSSLGLGLVYLLTITDAFVDAHLHSFDVSDDLSFRIKPSFQGIGSTPSIGMGICFSLSRTHSPLKINTTP
jgi:hypothetical protein